MLNELNNAFSDLLQSSFIKSRSYDKCLEKIISAFNPPPSLSVSLRGPAIELRNRKRATSVSEFDEIGWDGALI